MLTISLDEYGNFEDKDNKDLLFVAGVIYDDKEIEGELNLERRRLEAYFKSIINDFGRGYVYPQDLHLTSNTKNRTQVHNVKNKFCETIGEYIQQGTYNGKKLSDANGNILPERNGKYHIFVMLKSQKGKGNLLSTSKTTLNRLVDDNVAANRYIHMAGGVVNRIIIHNPLYGMQDVPPINLNIASRSTGNLSDMDALKKQEFVELKYEKSQSQVNSSGNAFYKITNRDIYRTLIGQELVNSGFTKINISEFNVSSIYYGEGAQNQEFLYLADSICSYLSYGSSKNIQDKVIYDLDEKCQKINPESENLIFGYDRVDNLFSKAWDYYEKGFMFEALSAIYDIKNVDTVFGKYYAEKWIPYFEENMKKKISPRQYLQSTKDLVDMLTTSNLDQGRALYIFEFLKGMLPGMEKRYANVANFNKASFKINEAGLSICCHSGENKKALTYFENCKIFAPYVGIDEYLSIFNRYVVCLEDTFEWELAKKVAEENLEYNRITEKYMGILLNKEVGAYVNEGKALSQYARVLSEERNHEAEEIYREALKKFAKNSADYKITQSYLLHYYADMGMKDAFEKEATDYFAGKSSYEDRFAYISKMSVSTGSLDTVKYAFFVFIKGLYYFGRENLQVKLWNDIVNWEQQKRRTIFSEHPNEITYKYLALLAYSRGDEYKRDMYLKRINESLSHSGPTIEALKQFGDAEVAETEKNRAERDQITLKLANYLKDNFEHFRNVTFPDNGQERYNMLQDIFTFMYR